MLGDEHLATPPHQSNGATPRACVVSDKRQRDGLAATLKTWRTASGVSVQVAATRAGMSLPRWRDAEAFGLATDETVAKLRAIGVPA